MIYHPVYNPNAADDIKYLANKPWFDKGVNDEPTGEPRLTAKAAKSIYKEQLVHKYGAHIADVLLRIDDNVLRAICEQFNLEKKRDVIEYKSILEVFDVNV